MAYLFVAGIYQLNGFTGKSDGAVFDLCVDHFKHDYRAEKGREGTMMAMLESACRQSKVKSQDNNCWGRERRSGTLQQARRAAGIDRCDARLRRWLGMVIIVIITGGSGNYPPLVSSEYC
jgi:hypothetical protein